jgi:hypothetical protein
MFDSCKRDSDYLLVSYNWWMAIWISFISCSCLHSNDYTLFLMIVASSSHLTIWNFKLLISWLLLTSLSSAVILLLTYVSYLYLISLFSMVSYLISCSLESISIFCLVSSFCMFFSTFYRLLILYSNFCISSTFFWIVSFNWLLSLITVSNFSLLSFTLVLFSLISYSSLWSSLFFDFNYSIWSMRDFTSFVFYWFLRNNSSFSFRNLILYSSRCFLFLYWSCSYWILSFFSFSSFLSSLSSLSISWYLTNDF